MRLLRAGSSVTRLQLRELIRTSRTGHGGHSGAKFKPHRVTRGIALPPARGAMRSGRLCDGPARQRGGSSAWHAGLTGSPGAPGRSGPVSRRVAYRPAQARRPGLVVMWKTRHGRTGSMDSYDVRFRGPGRSATPPKAAGGPARPINHELARLYPDAPIELDVTAPLELLAGMACRPESAVTRGIFPRAASGTRMLPPAAPARHVLSLADGPSRQACCVRCSSGRASFASACRESGPNCEASRIYLRRRRAAGFRSRDARNGLSVGQELARVVEEDDAVAQQAPPLLGVADDATGLGAVRPVGWGAWGPVGTHVVARGSGTDSFHCRLLGQSPCAGWRPT
jgi:hypothetical protein